MDDPKPALTIMDLMHHHQANLPKNILKPRENCSSRSFLRVVIPPRKNVFDDIQMDHLTTFSANCINVSPQLTPSTSENEDPPGNISIFTHNRSLPNAFTFSSLPIQHRPIKHMSFDEICSDNTVTLNPKRLNFIPASSWPNEPMSFGMIVSTFFRKRNSTHCKFPYKLYNALQISERYPEFIPFIGVQWATDSIIKVDREPFARLIGVKTIEGGLFHQQGNFPSHGFVELPFKDSDQLSRQLNFGPADLSVVRYVTHIAGKFVRGCTEEDLDQCRWSNAPSPFFVSNQ